MSNGDPLTLYSVFQLSELFNEDEPCQFIALKVKQEAQNIALHAIYIGKQENSDEFPFCALLTVTEWNDKSNREEFFIEAENIMLLLQKLERFDEIHRFTLLKLADTFTIDIATEEPQAILCALFPELGTFNSDVSAGVQSELTMNSLALLKRLEK